ncbi:T9SS type A sorting domain-containing protein [Paracrocinitomix mangrovi]|uniref:T9SS type A sorting domain-containing protein n=1 Tax=Paracrocinitomix mangrovi TaxID=2862509 RepID=UPI001C8ECDE4|nr:T9SS type A sorting domain-containing protein [Paracrocinitomix mangrovi]UKN00706.1 T9SS type A sorting domain-containing protein [Paracrocinitomix mangrovi]
MKKYFLSVTALLLAGLSTQAQVCTTDLTQTTSKMVYGAFWDNTGGMDSPAYLRQEGSTVYIDVIDHTTGRLYEGVGSISNYYLSNVEDRIVSGDFDGDGVRDDIAVLYQTGSSSCRIDVFTRWGGTSSGSGYGFDYHLNEWSSSGYNPDNVNGRFVSGLFDNDIYYDIAAFYDYGGGQTRIHVWKCGYGINPSYQGSTGWWSTYGYTAGQITDRVVTGDFDRDGKWNDIAAFYDYGSGQTRIHVWESNNSSFVYQGGTGWYTFPYGYDAYKISKRVVAGDFDRDGKNDDICAFYDYGGGATRAHVWESTGSSFAYPNGNTGYWMVTSGYSASSINGKIALVPQGSKLSDLVVLYNYGSNTTRYHHFEAQNPLSGNEYFTYSHVFFCTKSAEQQSNELTSDENINETLSTNEFNSRPTKLYPNPTAGELNIVFSDKFTTGKVDMQLMDMSGKLILSQQFAGNETANIQIDISAIPQGMYMVRLINENGEQEVLKITKK